MQGNQVLYSVQGQTGAHLLIAMRECQVTEGEQVTTRNFADVHMVGALLPYSVPAEDISPYQIEPVQKQADLINQLAQEAVTIYNLEPKRVQRACELARNAFKVQPAKYDTNGEAISRPSWKTVIVAGSKAGIWYVVQNGKCTCPDHENGNTCKHRIAAWMRRETIARPLAQARRTSVQIILQELEA